MSVRLEADEYLDLVEETRRLVFFDIEATGLRGDYSSVLVVTVKPYGCDPVTVSCETPGDDKRLVRDARELMEGASAWCGYYSKGFDIPMLNTRLLHHRTAPIDKRPHIDLYYTLKANLLMARRSQAHYLRWLATPEKKMDMSPDAWNAVIRDPGVYMPKMIKRCESDAKGLEQLYRRTRHLINEIKR